MEVKSRIFDHRINSENVLIQTTLGEYLDLISEAMGKNPFQRKRVTSSKTVYSLLREDIRKGCVIPPIVLALSYDVADNGPQPSKKDDCEIIDAIFRRQGDLLILDGLQRTHSFKDVISETLGNELDSIRNTPIRIEVYMGLNKIGILYRMLTLNSGQTPMSLRQQIEMLYWEYHSTGVQGIKFIREVDSEHATQSNEYNFKEVIEGFNSYLERNEQPLERIDLLENIRSLEKLSHENNNRDLFKEYVSALHNFILKVVDLMGGVSISKEDLPGKALWGKDAKQCFKKAQVFAGFGAAIGKLKDRELISNLEDIEEICDQLFFSCDPQDFLLELNSALDWISKNTKKIGSAQRMFFQFYFRELLNAEGDSFRDLKASIDGALHKTRTQLF